MELLKKESITDEGAKNLASGVIVLAHRDAQKAVKILKKLGIRNHLPEQIQSHLNQKYKDKEVVARKYIIPEEAIDGLVFMVDEESDIYFDIMDQERDKAFIDKYLLLYRQSVAVNNFFIPLARNQENGIVLKQGVSAERAAEMLGMSKSQIYKHASNGMPFVKVESKMKFDLKKCENWLIDRNYI